MKSISNFFRFSDNHKVLEPSVLDSLPPEIMQIVIRRFLPDEKDRGNLALTSRALKAQVNTARKADYPSISAFIMPREATFATGYEAENALIRKVKKGEILINLYVTENKMVVHKLISSRVIQKIEDGSQILISTFEGKKVLTFDQENCPIKEYKKVQDAYHCCLYSAWISTRTLSFFVKFYRRGLITMAAR